MNLKINDDGKLEVRFPYNPRMVEAVKEVDPRRSWDKVQKCWLFPAEGPVVKRLMDLFGVAEDKLDLPVRAKLTHGIMPKKEAPPLSLLDGHPWRRKPYDHQRACVCFLIGNEQFLLAVDMGLGKTYVVINRLVYGLLRHEFKRPILVVCPKSVVSVWPRELKLDGDLDSVVVQGTKEHRGRIVRRALVDWRTGDESKRWKVPIFVCGYETLVHTIDDMEEIEPEVVVGDEIHRIKDSTTQVFKAMRKVSKKSRCRWALSGTPAPNGPLDVFGTLTWLDSNILGTESKVAFEARYAVKRPLTRDPYDYRKIIVGYKDFEDLYARLNSVATRVDKSVLPDMPDKTVVGRYCELEGPQLKAYMQLKRDAVTMLKSQEQEGQLTVRNVLTEYLRLLQICGGFVPDDAGNIFRFPENAKLDLLKDMLEDLPEPLVIWASFIKEIKAISHLLHAVGRVESEDKIALFTGATSDDDRKRLVEEFQEGKLKYFVGTPQAGGQGLTLTAADTEVFYSRTYNLMHYEQASDRLHRIGQKANVTVINLIAKNTVDKRVAEALAKKEEMQELLLGKRVEEVFD